MSAHHCLPPTPTGESVKSHQHTQPPRCGLVPDGSQWRDPSRVPGNWREHLDPAEWVLGEEGLPERDAARVLIIRPRQDAGMHALRTRPASTASSWEALLVEGHDRDNPGWHWIFTVGGGCHEGEDSRTAAARELREETGIIVDPHTLIGPLATRHDIFEFTKVSARAHETFYGLILPDHYATDRDHVYTIDFSGWTEQEHELLDGMAWWTPDELREHMAQGHDVFPAELPVMIERLAGTASATSLLSDH